MTKKNTGKAAAGRRPKKWADDSGGLWSSNNYTTFRNCIEAKNIDGNDNKCVKFNQPLVTCQAHAAMITFFITAYVQIHRNLYMIFEFKIWMLYQLGMSNKV